MKGTAAALASIVLAAAVSAWAMSAQMVTWEQISKPPLPAADRRISYGKGGLAFGELRLPPAKGPYPVAVIIHGGCWRSEYDLAHASHMSAALARAGIAAWTIEYRRIGNAGAGWPGTFEDVAAGAAYVKTLAQQYPLDLKRIVFVGHSAGGHLALWLAARHNLPRDSPLAIDPSLLVRRSFSEGGRPRGVVALAAITDLRSFAASKGFCNQSVVPLLAGAPSQVADRYAHTSPAEMLPLGVPVRLVHGTRDSIVLPEQSHCFAKRATERGDDAQVIVVNDAGHFDLVAPFAPAWATVEKAITALVRP